MLITPLRILVVICASIPATKSIKKVATIELTEASGAHPMSAFKTCKHHQPLTKQDAIDQGQSPHERQKKGFCLNITMDLHHLLEDFQPFNQSFHVGLSYAVIETSSIFHFEAGSSVDDDVILHIKWHALFQWMKTAHNATVIGPFLGPTVGDNGEDRVCRVSLFKGVIGGNWSEAVSGFKVNDGESDGNPSSFVVTKPRARRSVENERTNVSLAEGKAKESIASQIQSDNLIEAEFDCNVADVNDNDAHNEDAAKSRHERVTGNQLDITSKERSTPLLKGINVVLRLKKKCVAELGNFTFFSNYSILRSEPSALFSKTFNGDHKHRFHVNHQKGHEEEEREKWCYPPTTTTSTTTPTTTYLDAAKSKLSDEDRPLSSSLSSLDEATTAAKNPSDEGQKDKGVEGTRSLKTGFVILFVSVVVLIFSVCGVSFVRRRVFHQWGRMNDEEDDDVVIGGEGSGSVGGGVGGGGVGGGSLGSAVGRAFGGGNAGKDEEAIVLPNTPIQRRVVNGRSVIEYGNSDWDCVIATSGPPKVAARQRDDIPFRQYPQKPHHTMSSEVDERQQQQQQQQRQQQQQQQDLLQVPLVDAADVNLTIVKQQHLQPQQHQLPEDLKICLETSSEDLVEFDRMSLGAALDLERETSNV